MMRTLSAMIFLFFCFACNNNKAEKAVVIATPPPSAPFNEPFAAYGPCVMNSREEIMEAFEEYNKGTFGSEEDLMN